MVPGSNVLIGRPPLSVRLRFGVPGGLIALLGVLVLLKGNAWGAVLLVIAFHPVSGLWRKATVSQTHLVAQGRVTRRVVELSTLTRIGVSPMTSPWVAPRDARPFYLNMAGGQAHLSASEITAFVTGLRERAVAAGATLEEESTERTAAPSGVAPWFSA